MKRLFFRYTMGPILCIAVCSCSYAQSGKSSSVVNNSLATDLAYNNKTKTREIPVTQGATTINISTKAVKNFTKNYKNAGNAGWFVIQDGYLAEFKKDGIKTNVYYNRKGLWLGNIRSYFEENLPRNIRHLVKSTYYDYTINYIQEITVDRNIVYLVKIEDDYFFKTVRIQDGEMDEFEVIKKISKKY